MAEVRGRIAATESHGCGKVAVTQRNGKDGVVGKVNLEAPESRLRHVRHGLP